MAAAAPVAAGPALPATAFLMALKNNVNVSAACISGVNEALQDSKRSRMAEYFSGRVNEGLNLLLPSVLEDLAFAKDKRAGLGHFVHQVPLWSMGVPDSCGYIGMHYCQVDAVPIFAKWGVCVPQECTIQDVMTAIFPPVTKKLAERIKGSCGPLHPERTLFVYDEPWAPGAIVTLTVLTLLLLAVLVSTAIDIYGDKASTPLVRDDDSPLVRVARCFSLRQNYARLTAPPRQGPFLCLDAVRVLSMLMILLGHTMFYETNTVGVTNPREAMGFYGRGFLSTGVGLIANSCLYGVDTFLALAGFLAVHLFIKELGKRLPHAGNRPGRSLLVMRMALGSYIRRYLRLTPAYAVILAVFTTLAPMLSSAPPSPTDLFHETGTCSVKWWQNMLYVNNLLSTTYTMCYLPSWFLCVVQQLFLVVPWLALLARRRPNAALLLCTLACLASYIYTFETAQREGWRLNGLDRPGFPNFFTHFYIKPFTRMPTFLIGGMGAILYDKHGRRLQSLLTAGRWPALRVWGIVAVALGILAVAVFGPRDEMAHAPGRWSQTSSSVFIALCWSAWTLGLAMLCAVVFAGQGGPLKALLELPFWSVLARLTFSTYLVHPMVIMVVISSRGGMPAHFSLVYLFHLFIGYSALAGLTACLFYFWVEAPFGELERLLFQRRPAPAIKGVVVEEERIKEDPLAGVVVVVPVSVGTEPREESTEAAVPQ